LEINLVMFGEARFGLHVQVPRASTQVDLEVFLQTAGKELQGELIYNADLFEESTAQRIAKHFKVRTNSSPAACL
jgi:hypothetical protein